MAAGDTVADQMEDRGSCSCLEGNPVSQLGWGVGCSLHSCWFVCLFLWLVGCLQCLTPYTCKDWKHRFGIARQVREKSRKFAKATK